MKNAFERLIKGIGKLMVAEFFLYGFLLVLALISYLIVKIFQ